MTPLVFGRNGQVARELQRRAPQGIFLGSDAVDLSDPAAGAAAIAAHAADVVINAAAYTAVDRAETDAAAAQALNAEAPARMAAAAAARGIPFLHVSTDYVFDGTGTAPWTPAAPTGPLGVYGRTKRAGEIGVAAAGGCFAILRTSWVFSAHGGNFVKTMLRLGQSRDRLDVVDDQIGGPTAAADIAEALLRMAEALTGGQGRPGVYHFAGAPETSWAGFAREIFRQAGLGVAVNDIPTKRFRPIPPARRPLNSRLDCSATETVFGISRPDWRVSLAAVLNELNEVKEAEA